MARRVMVQRAWAEAGGAGAVPAEELVDPAAPRKARAALAHRDLLDGSHATQESVTVQPRMDWAEPTVAPACVWLSGYCEPRM
jgi:hypothetical protein